VSVVQLPAFSSIVVAAPVIVASGVLKSCETELSSEFRSRSFHSPDRARHRAPRARREGSRLGANGNRAAPELAAQLRSRTI